MKNAKFRDPNNLNGTLKFIIIQFVILVAFACSLYDSMPISAKKINNASIQIQDIKNERKYNEYRVCIYSESGKYEFPNAGAFSKSSNSNILEHLKEGEQLSIKYTKKVYLFGSYNLIIDARNDSDVYLSLNDYELRRKSGLVGVVIVFLIIECLFASLFAINAKLQRNNCKKSKPSKQ